ncbi:MAG: ABC transporter ATP-binding protein [Spirochaetales bacterium]|nr:ABC transporter ATP-binding protein [Spirochaetales bacterium]
MALRNRIQKNPFVRFLSHLKGKWRFYYSFGLISVSTYYMGAGLITAFGIKWMTDGIVAGDVEQLTRAALFYFAALFTITLILPFIWFLFYRGTNELRRQLLYSLYAKVYKLPVSYIERNHSGDLISRLTNDVETASKAWGWQAKMLFQSTLSGAGSLVAIFFLDWRYGTIAVSLGIAIVVVNTLMAKPMRRIGKKVQEVLSILTQRFTDVIAGREIVKIFGLRKRLLDIFMDTNREAYRLTMKQAVYGSMLQGFGNFVSMFSFAGIFGIGSILIIGGTSELGTLLAVVNLLGGVLWLFRGFGNYVTNIQRSLAGADRIFEILDYPAEHAGGAAGETPTKTSKAIELSGISFSYEKGVAVFQSLDMRIETEKRIALVGSSGGGKTTLFKLLLGFYPPGGGTIRIFGKRLEDYSIGDVRDFFAFVPQDTFLFDGTARENITCGRPGAGIDDIRRCAAAAYADEFIDELPDGYDTLVGERGIQLSGGQRQRIAVARALLKDAPILLLDEATSSLDSESELVVQKALDVLMKGRTSLVIAHRLSTIRDADKIYVMEHGKIIEEGTHASLIEQNHRYAVLYRTQYAI